MVTRRISPTALAQDATPSAGNYPVVEVTAENYTFTLPESISGGWTELTFHNKGPADHHAMFMKLNEGTSFDEFKQAADAATDLGARSPRAFASAARHRYQRAKPRRRFSISSPATMRSSALSRMKRVSRTT